MNYIDTSIKWLFTGFITFFFLSSLWSCATPIQKVIEKTTSDQLLQMTPDQITAWKNAGHVVRACLQINGPPAAGSGTIMFVPSTDTQPINFGNDCHPIPPPIVITAPTPTTVSTTTTTTQKP